MASIAGMFHLQSVRFLQAAFDGAASRFGDRRRDRSRLRLRLRLRRRDRSRSRDRLRDRRDFFLSGDRLRDRLRRDDFFLSSSSPLSLSFAGGEKLPAMVFCGTRCVRSRAPMRAASPAPDLVDPRSGERERELDPLSLKRPAARA